MAIVIKLWRNVIFYGERHKMAIYRYFLANIGITLGDILAKILNFR